MFGAIQFTLNSGHSAHILLERRQVDVPGLRDIGEAQINRCQLDTREISIGQHRMPHAAATDHGMGQICR